MARLSVFIDANIFLSFYKYTKEDLEELRKLVALAERMFTLVVTEQLVDEIARNRGGTLADMLKRFRELRYNASIPAFFKPLKEYSAFVDAQQSAGQTHAALLTAIESRIASQTLDADRLIRDLFSQADIVKRTPEVHLRARRRFEAGNPPGKGSTFGDQINWETLLEVVDSDHDLCIVTGDGDFRSALNEAELNPVLLAEWNSKRKGKLFYYQTLTGFLRDRYKTVKLAGDVDRAYLIVDLLNSRSEAVTRDVVSLLVKHSSFTTKQYEMIVDAVEANDFVQSVLSEPEVYVFFIRLFRRFETKSPAVSDRLKYHLDEAVDENPEIALL